MIKRVELPPEVLADFRRTSTPSKRKGTPSRPVRSLQLKTLRQGSREKKLRLSNVKAMFLQMKDHA
jgi:hypothetical protein